MSIINGKIVTDRENRVVCIEHKAPTLRPLVELIQRKENKGSAKRETVQGVGRDSTKPQRERERCQAIKVEKKRPNLAFNE